LSNRKTFDHTVSDWIKHHIPFSLVLLDIDYFKNINDTHGHVIGDEVLKMVAQTMVEQTREEDLCFRYGGEEFKILIHDEILHLAYHIAERLRRAVAALENPTGASISLSLGIANFPQHGNKPVQLVAYADQALYQSKENGRNRTTLYQSGPLPPQDDKRTTVAAMGRAHRRVPGQRPDSESLVRGPRLHG
jgi:diguanylate cyclase (GGDEF)-like protein